MTHLYRACSRAQSLALCDTRRACISARLAGIGVQYEHVTLPRLAFDADAGPDEIIGSYIRPLDGLLSRMTSVQLDVASIPVDHPRRALIERELMTEHTHDVAEAQVLVHGGGVLFMRADDGVLALVCEAGDYARVPAGLAHWFALDAAQAFRSIRLFENRNAPRIRHRGADMRGRYRLSCVQRSAPQSTEP